jgi:kynureninase
MGVERLRAYSLLQQANLVDRLAEQGIAILGAGLPHGAFIAISTPKAEAAATRLLERGVVADAREDLLRFCPDILNSSQELVETAGHVAHVLRNV